jgi:EmrB/QacA subfamily drug resistance transporter
MGTHKWLPLTAVCLGTFVLLVDVTIVNVALPDMAGDLHTSLSALQWVIDAYALTLAALLIGVGVVADRFGHRVVHLSGLVVFALASLASGLAPNPGTLVAARVVQGIGGAAMLATIFGLLDSSYRGRDRGTAYGIWGAVSGASTAAGPLIGGPLTQSLSWRWIFFVNLPVSVAAIVVCRVALRDDAHARAPRRVDLAGMALFTAAIGALTFGMIRANENGWSNPSGWPLLVAGAVLLLAFAVTESRVREPLLDLALLRNVTFSGVLSAALLLNLAAYVSFAYTSIWLQSVLGLTPVTAGLVGLPMSVAAFAVSAWLGRRMHRLRARYVIGAGILLIGVGDLLGAVLVHRSASWPALLPGFFVVGVGVGAATPPQNATGMAAAPADRAGMAAGAVNTARQLGYAFGIALLGSVFTAGARRTLIDRHVPAADAVAHAIASGRPVASTGPDNAIHAAAASGIEALLAVAGLAGLIAAVISLLTIREPATSENTPEASPSRHPQAVQS